MLEISDYAVGKCRGPEILDGVCNSTRGRGGHCLSVIIFATPGLGSGSGSGSWVSECAIQGEAQETTQFAVRAYPVRRGSVLLSPR